MTLPSVPGPAPQVTTAQAPANRITVYGRTFEVVVYTRDPQGRKIFQPLGPLSSADLQNIQHLANQALAHIGQSPHWANVSDIDDKAIIVSTPGQQPQQHAHTAHLWTPLEQAVIAATQHTSASSSGVNPSAALNPTPSLNPPSNPWTRAPHLSLFSQPNAPSNPLTQLTYDQFKQLPPRARLRALHHIENRTIPVANPPEKDTLDTHINECQQAISVLPAPLLDNSVRTRIDTLYEKATWDEPPLEKLKQEIKRLIDEDFKGKEHLIDYYNRMSHATVTSPLSISLPNDSEAFIKFWKDSTSKPSADQIFCFIEALAYFADEDANPIDTSRQPLASSRSLVGSAFNTTVQRLANIFSAVKRRFIPGSSQQQTGATTNPAASTQPQGPVPPPSAIAQPNSQHTGSSSGTQHI